MKLRMGCFECKDDFQEIMPIELRDDGLYKITCQKGHKSIVSIQQQKFEILFELGAMALIDGYTREAVASFAAALERFYEYYIKVITLKNNIKTRELENTWKLLGNKSERQFGAFLNAYLLENKKSPVVINNKLRENFRNKVIHNGYIPREQEAIRYGEEVYNFMCRLINELERTSKDAMIKATAQYLKEIHAKETSKDRRVYSHIRTIVSLSYDNKNRGKTTFRESLKRLREYKTFIP